jgi:CrcB protein
MAKVLALAVGSLAGGFARYYLAGVVYRAFGSNFPYGTLAVNAVGCFLIGFLSVLAEEKFLIGPEARLLLMIGFCGAFTTFSTFILETGNLVKDGQVIVAFLNVLLSLIIGFTVFRIGIFLAKSI